MTRNADGGKSRKSGKSGKSRKRRKQAAVWARTAKKTALTSTEGCLKETGVSYRDRSKFPLLCFFIVKTGAAKAISHIAVKSRKK